MKEEPEKKNILKQFTSEKNHTLLKILLLLQETKVFSKKWRARQGKSLFQKKNYN